MSAIRCKFVTLNERSGLRCQEAAADLPAVSNGSFHFGCCLGSGTKPISN